MQLKRWLELAAAVGAAAVIFGSTVRAADEVSGLITRTYMIVEDTDLTGDVVSMSVPGRPVLRSGRPMWNSGSMASRSQDGRMRQPLAAAS